MYLTYKGVKDLLTKKIVHFFNSKNIHLNPSIIVGIDNNKESRHEHVFVINFLNRKCESVDTSVYDELMKKGFNIKYVYSLFGLLLMMIREPGVLLLHGTISPFKKNLLLFIVFYFFYKGVLGRVVLVAWAEGDFNTEIGAWSTMYKNILKNIKCIVTLSRVDYDLCLNLYDKRAIQINYINEKIVDCFSLKKSSSLKKKRIMISHSGWHHNRHLNSFEAISNKVGENYEIICPLAYGDQDYIGKVVKAGSKLFGDKFTYFDKLMDIEDYRVFLATIDIYVTSTEIQTGLFALTSCLANGAKVYCGSNLYKSLTECGFKVYSIDELYSVGEDDFYNFPSEDVYLNKAMYMKEYGDISTLRSKWNVIYDMC